MLVYTRQQRPPPRNQNDHHHHHPRTYTRLVPAHVLPPRPPARVARCLFLFLRRRGEEGERRRGEEEKRRRGEEEKRRRTKDSVSEYAWLIRARYSTRDNTHYNRPLQHTHDIVNEMFLPLFSLFFAFSPAAVWTRATTHDTTHHCSTPTTE